MTSFGVETIELDLPPLVAALGRRLRDRGLPLTPARSADFAHALGLVRPVSRRRLYWTARAVLVNDPAQVPAFDEVFSSIFGAGTDAAREDGAAGADRGRGAGAAASGERSPSGSGGPRGAGAGGGAGALPRARGQGGGSPEK